MRRVMSTGSLLLALVAVAWGGAGCVDTGSGPGVYNPMGDAAVDAGIPDVRWNVIENALPPIDAGPDAELDGDVDANFVDAG